MRKRFGFLVLSSLVLIGPVWNPAQTRPDGAESLYAPAPPESAQNPLFSPDGESLCFTIFHRGYNDGPAGLFLLTNEGLPKVLLDEPDHDSVNLPGSAWNRILDRITFSSDRQDSPEEIWTIDPEGAAPQRVTVHGAGEYFIEPSFSPDGEWIVFERDREVPDDFQQGSIWKVRRDGTGLTALTDGPGGGTDDRQPNWSPRGGRILFQRRTPGSDDWNLFTMAPDGSDVRQVTLDESEDTDGSWSPDGTWIVYSSDLGGLSVPNLFKISEAGGTAVRITSDETREDSAPSWSPDGTWIAFESRPAGTDGPASLWRIAVILLPGDCNGNGSVTIGEVQRAINMFLGQEAPACTADGNGSGGVTIGEVQRVINAFLGVGGTKGGKPSRCDQ